MPRNGIEQGLHIWLPYVRGIVVYSHPLLFIVGGIVLLLLSVLGWLDS